MSQGLWSLTDERPVRERFDIGYWCLTTFHLRWTEWRTLGSWGNCAAMRCILADHLSDLVKLCHHIFPFKPHPLPLKWLFYRKSLNQYFCKFLERYSVCFSNILMEYFLSDNFKILKWPSAACGLSNSLMKKRLSKTLKWHPGCQLLKQLSYRKPLKQNFLSISL